MNAETLERVGRVQDPASVLSRLILTHTGLRMDPAHIRHVLHKDFERVSALAHQIHDEETHQ